MNGWHVWPYISLIIWRNPNFFGVSWAQYWKKNILGVRNFCRLPKMPLESLKDLQKKKKTQNLAWKFLSNAICHLIVLKKYAPAYQNQVMDIIWFSKTFWCCEKFLKVQRVLMKFCSCGSKFFQNWFFPKTVKNLHFSAFVDLFSIFGLIRLWNSHIFKNDPQKFLCTLEEPFKIWKKKNTIIHCNFKKVTEISHEMQKFLQKIKMGKYFFVMFSSQKILLKIRKNTIFYVYKSKLHPPIKTGFRFLNYYTHCL